MKKQIGALLILFTLCLLILPTTAWADTPTHTHCLCGGHYTGDATHHTCSNVTFEAWDGTSLPSSGTYYLTKDITILDEKRLNGNLTLCLNGHKIECRVHYENWKEPDCTSTLKFVVDPNGHEFTITDCTTNGSIQRIKNDCSDMPFIYSTSGTFNLYGGTISDFNGYTGYNNSDPYGGAITIYNGTFNMYGGTISGNSASRGGGVYNGGTFNMYGGTITGNTATSGAGIYSISQNLNIYGGTISNNGDTTTGSGGGVYAYSVTMTGGTVSGSKATTGAGIYSSNSLNVSGTAEIKDNTATGEGGGLYGNKVNISGGTISGNKAATGGGVYLAYDEATLSGGTITGNSATTAGGGVYYGYSYSYSPTISGNIQITGNTLESGATATPNNFHLKCNISVNYPQYNNYYKFKIGDAGLGTNASIGISSDYTPTNDYPAAISNNGAAYAGKFFSDKTTCRVEASGDGLVLANIPTHYARVTIGETSTDYVTLAEAFAALNANPPTSATVTLLASTTESVTADSVGTITFDLNGKTLTAASGDTLTITGSSNVTIKNGNEDRPSAITNTGTGEALRVTGTGTVTIQEQYSGLGELSFSSIKLEGSQNAARILNNPSVYNEIAFATTDTTTTNISDVYLKNVKIIDNLSCNFSLNNSWQFSTTEFEVSTGRSINWDFKSNETGFLDNCVVKWYAVDAAGTITEITNNITATKYSSLLESALEPTNDLAGKWVYAIATYNNQFMFTTRIQIIGNNAPTLSVNPITRTYDGNEIPASAISGTATKDGVAVEGTWSWRNGAPKNVADSTSSTKKWYVAFTPNDTTTYDTAYGEVTVTINPKQLTIMSITAQSRAYEKGNTSVALSSNGNIEAGAVCGSDSVGYTIDSCTMADDNAGNNKRVTVNVTLTGSAKDNYTVRVNPVTVDITPKEITNPYYEILGGYNYTGSVVTPLIRLFESLEGALIPASEYTVTGSTDASTKAPFTIVNKEGGNYIINCRGTFSIFPLYISSATVDLGAPPVYGTSNTTQTVQSVTYKISDDVTLTLTEGTDYTVSGNTATTAGKHTLTLTGKGNFAGTKNVDWILGAGSATLSTAPTAKTPTWNNTAQSLLNPGTAQNGTIWYRLGTSGAWTTTVPTATNANTYTVYYYVKGDATNYYTDLGSESAPLGPVTVTITQLDLTDHVNLGMKSEGDGPMTNFFAGRAISGRTYTGSAFTWSLNNVQWMKSEHPILEDIIALSTSDYEITVSSGVTYTTTTNPATLSVTNAGTHTVTVTGKGNYKGSCTFDWVITPKEITNPYYEILGGYNYTGSVVTPNIRLYESMGGALIPASEYTVTGSTDASDNAPFTIVNKEGGNYSINCRGTFKIDPRNMFFATVVLGSQPVYGTSNTTQTIQSVTYKISDSVTLTLTEGKDYTVSGNTATTAGSHTLTLTGKGNFTGTKTVDWYMLAGTASITQAPTGKDLTYNGESQPLLNAGTAQNGTIYYRVGTSGAWTTTVPTAKDANEFDIYYYLKGDDNYADLGSESEPFGPVHAKVQKYDISNVEYDFRIMSSFMQRLGYLPGDTDAFYVKTDAPGSYLDITTFFVSKDPTKPFSYSNGNYIALTHTVDYSTTMSPDTLTGYGTYTFKLIGMGNFTGAKTMTCHVIQKLLTIDSFTVSEKKWDGTTSATLDSITLNADDLVLGTDYTATAQFADSEVGENKKVTVTVTLKDTEKAKKYMFLDANAAKKDGTGTIQPEDQTITAADIRATYGDTDKKIVPTGTVGTVSYAVTSGNDVIDVAQDGTLTLKKAGSAQVTITASGDTHYAPGTKVVNVTVAKAPVTITAIDRKTYANARKPSFDNPEEGKDYTISGLIGTDTLEKTVQITLSCDADTRVPAEFDIIVTITGEDSRYALTPVNGTLTVIRITAAPDTPGAPDTPSVPDTPGTTPTQPIYPVTVPETGNGSIDVSPIYAPAGTTVIITVTPGDGQVLDTITVTDTNGNALPLLVLGGNQFAFTQPEGGANVNAAFRSAEPAAPTIFFVDVPESAYFYDAVVWAVEHGITTGTDDTHFSPNLPCTRAQMVTFLWRAAGCPVVDYLMEFDDVQNDQWYTEAIRWAASEGIVSGYGNGLFGTEDEITREQIVTILYRFALSQGMDAGEGDNVSLQSFKDASSIAEYARAAMRWAVGAKIMQGYDGSLTPQDACTRAQIVTLLYRMLSEA